MPLRLVMRSSAFRSSVERGAERFAPRVEKPAIWEREPGPRPESCESEEEEKPAVDTVAEADAVAAEELRCLGFVR